MDVGKKIKNARIEHGFVATERRIMRFSWIAILIGLIISILDILFKGNPALE